jgi:aconitate hydratase
MWDREGAEKKNETQSFTRSTVTSKRADGNPNTMAFVGSPELVTAMAIAGDLGFNPLTDTLINEDGEEVMLDAPTGDELPKNGFDAEDKGFQEPAADGRGVEVTVSETSDRLQLLAPFAPWDGKNITGAKLLIKAFGKCTTDHISMAGPWLRFRGHLDNISNNMLIGAINAYNQKTNSVKNQLTGVYDAVPAVARAYKAAGVASIVVGDHNYGEGSSRSMLLWNLVS